MGQATITADRGEGLYEILIDRGLGRLSGRLEAATLRIAELEVEATTAQESLDEASDPEIRRQLQLELDVAIQSYRVAVDERCTQESIEIPDLDEFRDAFADINAAQDEYYSLVNEIGRLNRDLTEAAHDAYRAAQVVVRLQEEIDGLRENLEYFEDLYSQTWDALIDCFDPFHEANCSDADIERIQFFLFWYFLALSAYRDAIANVEDDLREWEAKLSEAVQRYVSIEAEIEASSEPLDELKEALAQARRDYQAVVIKLRPITDICDPRKFAAEQAVVDAAIKAIGEHDIEVARLKAELALAQAHLLNARMERDRLQAATDEATITREAWCLDYTTGATGFVGTAEIPGEPQNVLIVPGATDPMTGDGYLLSRAAMTPAQSATNIALLPGWQKWMPTYRVGTLVDKDDDLNLGSVDLDEARSSATGMGTISPITGEDWGGPEGDPAGLAVNQGPLGWLEFDYMECDSLAFEVGDRVVVKFPNQQWANDAVIIGFESEPKECPAGVTLSLWIFGIGTFTFGTGNSVCGNHHGMANDSEYYLFLPDQNGRRYYGARHSLYQNATAYVYHGLGADPITTTNGECIDFGNRYNLANHMGHWVVTNSQNATHNPWPTICTGSTSVQYVHVDQGMPAQFSAPPPIETYHEDLGIWQQWAYSGRCRAVPTATTVNCGPNGVHGTILHQVIYRLVSETAESTGLNPA